MDFNEIANKIGAVVTEKNKAYGNAIDNTSEFLKILYPSGIAPEQYKDLGIIVRIFDKVMRIAHNKDAFGESPYMDIAGYGILGVSMSKRTSDGN